MENLQNRRQNYLQRLNRFDKAVEEKKRKTPREIVKEGVQRSTQINDEKTLNVLVDKAIQGEQYVKQGDYDTYLFAIAESIESVHCETTSMNEYFSWIEKGKDIMRHMSDGVISQADIDEKTAFIKESWQREAEILTCLGLYERSNNPLAKERHAELLLKLMRLRQIRSALETETRDVANEKALKEEERQRYLKTIKTFDDMRYYDENGDYNNASMRKQLTDLQIDHFSDAEFLVGYSFYLRLLEEQYRADLRRKNDLKFAQMYQKHPDEYWALLKHRKDTKEIIGNRILQLSGRKSLSLQAMQERIRQHAFNLEDFRRLQKLRERMRNKED